MYHLRIQERGPRQMSELVPNTAAEEEDNDFMEVFREPLDKECVEFSVGNPRVEHITGLVHLYKQNDPQGQGSQQEPWRSGQKQSVEISEVGLGAHAAAAMRIKAAILCRQL